MLNIICISIMFSKGEIEEIFCPAVYPNNKIGLNWHKLVQNRSLTILSTKISEERNPEKRKFLRNFFVFWSVNKKVDHQNIFFVLSCLVSSAYKHDSIIHLIFSNSKAIFLILINFITWPNKIILQILS